MKNKIFVLFLVLFINFSFVFAQTGDLDAVPGGDLIQKVAGEDGEPKGIQDVKDKIDDLQKGNQNYLFKEWTELSFIGSIFQFTEGFFSFFNPLWRYTFGIEFSWTGIFFLHVFLWVVIIIALFFPAREFFQNSLFAIITGVIFASITGRFRIISRFVVFLNTAIGDRWYITAIFVFIVGLLLILERSGVSWLKDKDTKEKLERADESREAAGEVSRRMIEGMSESGRKAKTK